MKFIKLTGLLILVMFSFFYTDKVAKVISEKDSLMIELKKVEKLYKTNFIDGEIKNDTIIPGLNGREINIDKSYKKMREYGKFDNNLIVYNQIKPNISISNNKDKYIVKGNNNKQMVSIIFLLDDNKFLDRLENIINDKEIVINYFITSNYLVSNSTDIVSLKNREIYNYGDYGKYTPDNLIFANNLISRITKRNAIYCLVKKKNKSTLDLCSNNGLYTILPNVIINNNLYSVVKDNVSSGSIILMDINNTNIIEIGIVIDYIKGKGLKIGGLSELLSEKL